MDFPITINSSVNFFAFLGLTVATYTIFYFGRMMNPKKGIDTSLFTLALGINLIGLAHLFRVFETVTSSIELALIGLGSFFASAGVIWVFYEKSREISRLTKREQEINSVIDKMKDTYYQQGLSEEDLKRAYSDLLRELAEIEVKLGNKSSKFAS